MRAGAGDVRRTVRAYLLVRQPRMADDDLLVRAVESPVNPARLEVPEHHVALPVSRRQEATVRREVRLARVTGNGVTCEPLLALRGSRSKGHRE